jgi:hypothetical protein
MKLGSVYIIRPKHEFRANFEFIAAVNIKIMYGLLDCDAAHFGGEVLMIQSNLLLQSSEYKSHKDAVSSLFQTAIKYQEFTLQGRVQGAGTWSP